MKVKDLELIRYRYCARKTLTESEDSLWTDFKSLLEKAVEEIGGFGNTTATEIKQEDPLIGYYVPLISSKDNLPQGEESNLVYFKDLYRTLAAGTFLDVYTLQQSIATESDIISLALLSDQINKLKEKITTYSQIDSEFEARCFCYFTEFPEDEDETNKIFSVLLGTETEPIDLGYAYFAVNATEKQAWAAIVSKNNFSSSAKDKAIKLFTVLLREYFLSYVKIFHEMEILKKLNIEKARRNLSGYLNDFKNNPPKTLKEIENATRQLTVHRVELAGMIKTIEAHLHTMRINIRNGEKILENELLVGKKDELQKMLIKPLALSAEQIEANLDYLRIDEEKAAIVGEEITNLSNLQTGEWGRKLSWIFGLFSLLGALQLFPEFQNWEIKDPISLWSKIGILAALIILIPSLILYGKTIKNKIFK